MPDLYDSAQEREQQNTQAAHQAHTARLRPEPPQTVVDGRVLCIDCDEPVQPARLAAKPNAARCFHCQGITERKHGR
ncbi:TraR/DksA C4-type zinc finger protein [Marinobacterium rhizophilum]|uniref:TraR/DksA C4-type zinc finger protein n=1 Tax=Marinobacterium rhizophilum TaxID=420402 RepID=A0ABY5HMY7_9GAMM|nr:TraR/DksA C4-type zinc finger protein [Marinobacterium rhizophilum]UTW12948.1 TraR/DksA C4-type zinc finger protein [Marinobacterium rhizophilum]